MATKKKLLQAAAGSAGSAGLDVEDVFSTYLYEGASAAQTITNGVDLAGEGGMVWGKQRTGTGYHWIFDTERGHSKWLYPNDTMGEQSGAGGISSFNSDGFDLQGTSTFFNGSGQDYASWTWRKAPKFFDCVQYTGNGTAGRTLSHSLGSVPGMVLIKPQTTGEWSVYHRGSDSSSPEDYYLSLDSTSARIDDTTRWNDTAPTSTEITLGNNNRVNENGEPFVAYFFAHNDGDGEFGPDGDADIIKCGSYTGNDTSQEIDVGFEPQWLMIKRATGDADWLIFDSMRNWITSKNGSGDSSALQPNNNEYESAYTRIHPSANGFGFDSEAGSWANQTGETYIYMAIRRGPMAVPESATDVFEPVQAVGSGAGNPAFVSTFTTDAAIFLYPNGGASFPKISSRLTGATFLETHSTGTEAASDFTKWDFQTGAGNGGELTSDWNGLLWKRAPGFFDAVAYTGNRTGGASQVISHNLTVAPEMIWVKNRTEAQPWQVYTAATGNTKAMYLDTTNGATTDNSWGNTSPTDTNFTVGDDSGTNNTGNSLIAYLFASVDGVSKVGSVSHTSGTPTNVDCGFSAGARFIILKRYDATSNWWVFDTERGIAVGNDARLYLDTTVAETSTDQIDPYSAGFTIDSNRATGDYIFYAIA